MGRYGYGYRGSPMPVCPFLIYVVFCQIIGCIIANGCIIPLVF